jgi:hypothetical protein
METSTNFILTALAPKQIVKLPRLNEFGKNSVRIVRVSLFSWGLRDVEDRDFATLRISDVADAKAALLDAVNARKEAHQAPLGREWIVRNQLIQDLVDDPELLNFGVAFIAAFDTRLRV